MPHVARKSIKTNTILLSQKGGASKSTRKASKNRPQKLRKSLTAGTVVIPLSGPYRGKRVVMLKQIVKSGLLLVTGPFKVNGCPLRRINARFVIATSTKVALPKLNLEKFDDAYFKAPKKAKGKDGEEEFFAKDAKPETSAAKKADQKAIDDEIVKALAKDPMMTKYLKSTFALSNGDMPHRMKF